MTLTCMDFFQCVKKCRLRLHFTSVAILIGFFFSLPSHQLWWNIRDFNYIGEIKPSFPTILSPVKSVWSWYAHSEVIRWETQRHIHSSTIAQETRWKVRLWWKERNKKLFKSILFFETYLLQVANWSWDMPKAYLDITQEWLEKGI